MKKVLNWIELLWPLTFPLGMAIVAIVYHSDYSNWFIWAGWLFNLLYIVFFLMLAEYNKKYEQKRKINLGFPILIMRLILLGTIPAFSEYFSIQDFFYSAALTESVTLFIVLIYLIFTHKDEGKTITQEHGLWFSIFVLVIFACTIYPFIAEGITFYSTSDSASIAFLIAMFVIEFIAIYKSLGTFLRSDTNDTYDIESSPVLIAVLVGWIVILCVVYSYVN